MASSSSPASAAPAGDIASLLFNREPGSSPVFSPARIGKKVTIVGCGAVGIACAYSILNQGIASEIVLLDIPAAEAKVCGEVADLVHGSAFAPRTTIRGGADHALSAGSTVVVVTAGARQNPGESRLDLVGRNLTIFKGLIPSLVRHSPDCVLLIVSNPVVRPPHCV